MSTRFLCLIVFIGFALFFSGCGPKFPSTHLSGRVSVDGKVLSSGSIMFAPTESGTGSGVLVFINPDGTYAAERVPLGKVRVTISSEEKTGKKAKGPTGEEVDAVVSIIPASKAGGIVIDVTSGQTVCDFEWESDKEKTFRGPGL